MKPHLILVSLLGLLASSRTPAAPPAAEIAFQSGPAQVPLIELYTSEGCSSCPPAEDWLNALRVDSGLWKEFVPVSFHVTYWDDLGWRDAFASKAFTARQYAFAADWRQSSVYTPCFVRNGREWQRSGTRPTADRTAPAGGILTLARRDPTHWRVTYLPASADGQSVYEAQVAWLGGGIATDVRMGENSGRKLIHEFVALNLTGVTLKADARNQWNGDFALPASAPTHVAKLAIAGWITRRGDSVPIQATGGFLP